MLKVLIIVAIAELGSGNVTVLYKGADTCPTSQEDALALLPAEVQLLAQQKNFGVVATCLDRQALSAVLIPKDGE